MFQNATVMLRLVWSNDRIFEGDGGGQGLFSAQNMLVDSKAMPTKLERRRVLPVIAGA